MSSPAHFIAQFDSTTSMLYASGFYLHRQLFAAKGIASRVPSGVGALANRLPGGVRDKQYCLAGWWGSIPPGQVGGVMAAETSRWVTEQYPTRRFPAAMIGSMNGAAIHLCSAFGSPRRLPQTGLVTVKRRLHPDELGGDRGWGQRPPQVMAAANPEW